MLFCTLCIFFSPLLWAHGDLHEKIERITHELAEDPDNTKLLLERGQTYFQHEEYNNALGDYERAIELDSTLVIVHLLRAETYLAVDHPGNARKSIDRFLKINPDNVDALYLSGKIAISAQDFERATTDLSRTLELTQVKRPELYALTAHAWGKGLGDYNKALVIMDQAISENGFIISLYEIAVEIAAHGNLYPQAIAYIEEVIDRLPRHEKWLLLKAKVLEQSGNMDAAQAAYQAVLDAIFQLPVRIQQTPAVKQTRGEAMAKLSNH